MTWAALAVASLLIGDRADNEFGRVAFWTFGLFLFSVGLFTAPWAGAFS